MLQWYRWLPQSFQHTPGVVGSVTGCDFRDSYADAAGGAIRTGDYAMTISDSTFHNCSTDGSGGAIAGRSNSIELLTITDCTFTECSASNGGALQLVGETLVENCRFERNMVATSGGAIRCRFANSTIRGCEFVDNFSESTAGTINWNSVPSGVFESSTITGSTATSSYASTLLSNGAQVLFRDITITGANSAQAGGGVYISANSNMTLDGTIIITGNTVGSSAGGLRLRSNVTVLDGAQVRIYGNTDQGNAATSNVRCDAGLNCANCGLCTAGYCDLTSGECLCGSGATADVETGDCDCDSEGTVYDPLSHECIAADDDVDGDAVDDDADDEDPAFPLLPVAVGTGAVAVVVLGGMLLLQRRNDSDDGSPARGPSRSVRNKAGTVEHAIKQLIATVPVETLNQYARDLLKQGHKKEALCLIVRLEPAAQKKSPAGEYIQVLQTYTDVLEANDIADGVKDVKAAKRATMQLDQNAPLGGGRPLAGKGVDQAWSVSYEVARRSPKKADMWESETVAMSRAGDSPRKNSGVRKGSKSGRGSRGRKGSKSSRGRKGPAEDVVSLMPPES